MKRNLLPLLTCLVMLIFSAKSNAQSTLIHYWDFNAFTGAMHTDTIHGIDADYSIHDTSKAKILYAEVSGTSSVYATYVDAYTTVTADYDTVNARLSAPAGIAMRVRNPSDSMQLLFYIPSVNYTHILLQYGSESSSTTSGMTHQNFSYSVDSGVTWRTAGLSILSDSAWLAFHRTAVSLATDSSVKSNDKLVFRIQFSGHNTGTSGNNRFDNVTVEGDSIEHAAVSITANPVGPVCAGTSVTFSALATVNTPNTATKYNWYVNGVSAGADSTGFTTTLLTTGSLVKCVVTDSIDGSVLATSSVITMTVNPLPNAGIITGSSNVCPTAVIDLFETVSGGTWSASNAAATISTLGVVTGVTSGLDTITYHVSTSSCGSADTTFIVTVSTTPSPGTITGSSIICIGSGSSFTETVSGGTWSASNGNATVSTLGVVTGVNPGVDTINYTVATCGTSHTSYTVTVSPLPSAGIISGLATACTGVSAAAPLSETVSGGTWSTSNANATISSSGVVSGVTVGADTVIYVVSGCGTSNTSYPISIIAAPVAGSISGSSSICVDSATILIETSTGGTWSSSNPDAIISSGGVLIGALAGTDTISYTVSNVCDIVSAAHIVTVNAGINPGTITGRDTLCVGDTATLSDDVTGGSWISLDATASISPIGLVTGISAGIDSIGYYFTTPCVSFAGYIVTVRPLSACPEKVNTIKGSANVLKIYPNPSNGTFTVYFTSQENEAVQITISSIVGEKVKEVSTPANQSCNISLDQPSGIYFINAVTAHGTYTEKVTVVH